MLPAHPRRSPTGRRWLLALLLPFALLLAACGSDSDGGADTSAKTTTTAATEQADDTTTTAAADALEGEITVSAAASLTESFTEIGKDFEADHPGTKVTLTFDSSGTLAQQILDGAPVDVFASADRKQMDAAIASKVVDAPTSRVFTHNQLVVIVPRSNPAKIESLADLARPSLKIVVADKAHGYMFTLLKVTPYPQASDVTPPEDYEAWLRVDPAVDPLPSATAALDTPFTLTPGETIGLDGTDMMVGLLSVDDTRCPIDLACGAGGRNSVAVGLLVLDQWGETEQIKLTGRTGYDGLVLPPTAGLEPEVAVGDYTVKLLRVMPFPQSTDKVTQHDYRVTLSISSSLGTPEPTAEPTVEPTATPIPQAEGEARLGEPFDLRLNESVTVAGEGVQIEFRGIQTDSRCPSDVMCAWSGVVGLQFTATGPRGATGHFVLGGYADLDGVVRPVMEAGVAPVGVVDDYMISITHIRPYPAHHDQTIAPEEYVATLVVTKRK